jgi:hypothetical protein
MNIDSTWVRRPRRSETAFQGELAPCNQSLWLDFLPDWGELREI